jgi:hypothetical protein
MDWKELDANSFGDHVGRKIGDEEDEVILTEASMKGCFLGCCAV